MSYYKAGLVGIIAGVIFITVGIIIAVAVNFVIGVISCAMGAGICALGYYYIKKAASAATKQQESKSTPTHKVYTDYIDALPESIDQDGVTYLLHYKYSQVGVACNTMPDYADASSGVSGGDVLELEQEPDNPYDSNAVAVTDCLGNVCGYLYRGRIQDMANGWLSKGTPIYVIAENDGCNTLTIGFYKE